MSEKLEILNQKLEQLENEKQQNIREKNDLLKNSPEVKRFVRLGYEERKLEREISNLEVELNEALMLNCNHAFVNIDSEGNKYCVKCGLSTELTERADEYLKNIKIYDQTEKNSTVINIDYICNKNVVKKIGQVLALKYPYISEDEFAHFVAVAIHNMQTKKKSDNVKRNRAKRLYLRPSFLEKSNML